MIGQSIKYDKIMFWDMDVDTDIILSYKGRLGYTIRHNTLIMMREMGFKFELRTDYNKYTNIKLKWLHIHNPEVEING